MRPDDARADREQRVGRRGAGPVPGREGHASAAAGLPASILTPGAAEDTPDDAEDAAGAARRTRRTATRPR